MIGDLAQETTVPGVDGRCCSRTACGRICAVPLTTALRRLGALGFGSLQPHAYRASDLEFMQHVAKQVAVAVDNVLHDKSARPAQAAARARTRSAAAAARGQQRRRLASRTWTRCSRRSARASAGSSSTTAAACCSTTRRPVSTAVHVLQFATASSSRRRDVATKLRRVPPAARSTTPEPGAVRRAGPARAWPPNRTLPQGCSRRASSRSARVPLLSHDRVLGSLNVGPAPRAAFTPEDVELLGQVAQQIAIAVENGLAYRQIAELKEKLSKEKLYLEEEIRTDYNFGEIVGESARAQAGAAAGRDRRADRLDRPDPGRDRHGQGADRPRDPQPERPHARGRSSS